jgi:hypothetical protein
MALWVVVECNTQGGVGRELRIACCSRLVWLSGSFLRMRGWSFPRDAAANVAGRILKRSLPAWHLDLGSHAARHLPIACKSFSGCDLRALFL